MGNLNRIIRFKFELIYAILDQKHLGISINVRQELLAAKTGASTNDRSSFVRNGLEGTKNL
jgi:hypothetical protein